MANKYLVSSFASVGPMGVGMIAPVVEIHTASAAYAAADIVIYKLPIVSGLGVKTAQFTITTGTAKNADYCAATKIALSTTTNYEQVSVTLGSAVAIGDKLGIVAYYGL